MAAVVILLVVAVALGAAFGAGVGGVGTDSDEGGDAGVGDAEEAILEEAYTV